MAEGQWATVTWGYVIMRVAMVAQWLRLATSSAFLPIVTVVGTALCAVVAVGAIEVCRARSERAGLAS